MSNAKDKALEGKKDDGWKESKVRKTAAMKDGRNSLRHTEFFKDWKKKNPQGGKFPREEFMKWQSKKK